MLELETIKLGKWFALTVTLSVHLIAAVQLAQTQPVVHKSPKDNLEKYVRSCFLCGY